MEPPVLLTRDEFREQVFARDNHQCIICKAPAKDAHHIIERRLWSNGGYYLENGASLCEPHHILAEQTILSCDEIRHKAKITRIIIPDHLYDDQEYDKWGNIILPNGTKYPGELFNDESVQKILKEGNVLSEFSSRIKHPRTMHFPWSDNVTDDDRIIKDFHGLENKEIVVTIKLDGEQTTMYHDYVHARSLESEKHPSRTWVHRLHGMMGYKIDPGWRVCCENLFAKHSIHYHNLDSYCYVHSIWDNNNICQNWDDTVLYASVLDLPIVPVIYRGMFDPELIKTLYTPTFNGDDCEGYVVRTVEAFHYSQYRYNVAKYVRKNYVIDNEFWKHSKLVQNELKEGIKLYE